MPTLSYRLWPAKAIGAPIESRDALTGPGRGRHGKLPAADVSAECSQRPKPCPFQPFRKAILPHERFLFDRRLSHADRKTLGRARPRCPPRGWARWPWPRRFAAPGVPADAVDEVIMGNVLAAGLGQAPARQAALFAGLPDTIAALTINKVCGSGLKAVMLADQAIRAGDAQVIVAGGMESMSRAPFLLDGARHGWKFGDQQVRDSMLLRRPVVRLRGHGHGGRGRLHRRDRAASRGPIRMPSPSRAIAAPSARSGATARRDRAGDGARRQSRDGRQRRTKGRGPTRRWKAWPSCGRRSARRAP